MTASGFISDIHLNRCLLSKQVAVSLRQQVGI